ncbi:MAG: hypothetical protein ACXWZZ_12915, partial [Solirubrobacteraceae bacterium]
MSPDSLFDPPPRVAPDDREADTHAAAPPRRPGLTRRGLALLLALTALISGAAGAGLLLATGAGGGTTSTTIT